MSIHESDLQAQFKAEFRTILRVCHISDKELFLETRSILEEIHEDETRELTRFDRIALEELVSRFGTEKGFCEKPDISLLESVKDNDFTNEND
jgi:hypothetical protein